jgi:hypothetical protein
MRVAGLSHGSTLVASRRLSSLPMRNTATVCVICERDQS